VRLFFAVTRGARGCCYFAAKFPTQNNSHHEKINYTVCAAVCAAISLSSRFMFTYPTYSVSFYKVESPGEDSATFFVDKIKIYTIFAGCKIKCSRFANSEQ